MKHLTRARSSRRKYDDKQVRPNISTNLLTTYTQIRPKFHNHLVLPLKGVTTLPPPPPPKTTICYIYVIIRMYIYTHTQLCTFLLYSSFYSPQIRKIINLKKVKNGSILIILFRNNVMYLLFYTYKPDDRPNHVV
jgi:hypothetical protein